MNANEANVEKRQSRMALLARGPVSMLEDAWKKCGEKIEYRMLRAPETGMVMVRARTGNTGTRFNLGEATCTRCAVRLENGVSGFGYVLGRNQRHAELAAVFDALSQENGNDTLLSSLFDSLHEFHSREQEVRRKDIEKTRVDFFTLVRGDE